VQLEHRFCKSARTTSAQETLSTRLALQTLPYPLHAKVYEFPTQSVQASQVGWFVFLNSAHAVLNDPPLHSSTNLHLLWV